MNLDCADRVAEALALRPGSSGSKSEFRAAPGEHRKAHEQKGADRGRPGRLGHDRTAAGWIGPLAGRGVAPRRARPGVCLHAANCGHETHADGHRHGPHIRAKLAVLPHLGALHPAKPFERLAPRRGIEPLFPP